MTILTRVGSWYQAPSRRAGARARGGARAPACPSGSVLRSLAILVALVFSKNVYLASLTSFYTFYLIHKFGVSVQSAQMHLFVLLGAVAAGTFIGGPVGDRIGRKYVIWVSILGVLPFTLLLPYANLFWTEVLTVVIGLILASAFSAIVVFAQELVPGRVGTISGLFFGFAFGAGAVGAALLGLLADATSIDARLQGLLVPAGDRAADGLPAQPRARAEEPPGPEAASLLAARRRAFACRAPYRLKAKG